MNPFSRWWILATTPPAVVISRAGTATDNPQVTVHVQGVNGMQGVYAWPADERGEALATLYGKGLSVIIQRPLVDERT